MTIATELRRAGPFTGNGVTVSFPFGFKVFAPGDVLVVRTTAADGDQTLDLTSDYSVTLAADQNTQPGGAVVLTAPLAAGAQLTILSQVAALQPTELTNQGGFYPQVLTRAFDRATILIQQLAERVGRSLVLSPTEEAVTIPAPAQRTGGRILGFNRITGAFEVQDGSAFAGVAGPADNTYTSYAALLASDKSRKKANLVGDTDVPPQPDGPFNVVNGEWARQTAQGIVTTLDAPGAVPLDQETVSNLEFNVFKLFTKAMQASIKGRTQNNNKAAAIALALVIQGGIDAAAARGADFKIPAGLYNIAPTGMFDAEAGSIGRCFRIPSNMKLIVEPGATFRIVNGVSTDAAPFFHCMFGTNEELENVQWSGLEMDMNGQNNPISPNRGAGVYALFNQAMIHVTGTTAGRAARINNASIDNCRFINCPGVSCVVMGQSNTVDSGLGSGWSWTNSTCYNNGLDTIDHSSGYGWAENVSVTDNTFYNDAPLAPTGVGMLVAYEIHGSHTTFARNRVRNGYQGLWIDGNSSAISYSVQVLNNTLDRIGAFGILFFGQSATAAPVHGALIQGNTITLDDTVYAGIDLKYGIGTAGQYSQTDVRVLDNFVRGIGTATAKGGVVVTAGTIVGQKHDDWLIKGNTFENVSAGVALYTNATVGLGNMKVLGNTSKNLIAAGAFTVPQGVAVSSGGGLIDDLMVVENDYLDSRGAPLPTSVGVRLEGAIGRFTMYDNRAPGAAVPYAEAGFSAVSRRGRFLIKYDYDPAPIPAGGSIFVDIPVPNLLGDHRVTAHMNVPLNGATMTADYLEEEMARVTFVNPQAAEVNPGSGTIFVLQENMA